MAEIFFFEIVQHVNEPLQGDILIGADQNIVFPVSAGQMNGEFIQSYLFSLHCKRTVLCHFQPDMLTGHGL